jgi:hypothetical protein
MDCIKDVRLFLLLTSRFNLSVAGLFDHSTDSSTYTIHTHLEEAADTILTILYLKLLDAFERSNPEELTITFDNKGTAKNYLLIALLEYIVVQQKALKLIRLIFLTKGHTVSIQDVLNFPFATAFFRMTGMIFMIFISLTVRI